MLFWVQMECDTSPSGDGRLSNRASHSRTEPDRAQVLDLRPPRQTGNSLPTQAEIEDSRETLAIYAERYGRKGDVADLSVDVFQARGLATTPFAGVVEMVMNPGVVPHPSLIETMERKLGGRDPRISFEDSMMVTSFLLEDDLYESRMRAAHFGFTLALLVDGVPLVSVGRHQDHNEAIDENGDRSGR